jgi:hypothetical protein
MSNARTASTPVALHDDSLRLVDAVTTQEGGLQSALRLAGDDRRGGVCGEHSADGFGFDVPRPGLIAEQVECPGGPLGGIQLERQATEHADRCDRGEY